MNEGTKLGPFTIEEELGSGAMGTVYRADFADKQSHVAIKVISPGISTSETSQARFQREANILKQLRHPNIVRLVAVGKYKKSPFYAMEYIEGESVAEVLARRGRLSWEELVQIGEQLCEGLQHAHDKGIVHRDLKPSNLMITMDGTVKLTDFGIAKDLDVTGLTATNCTVGTASYMSPEQCKGEKDISYKSDLYSMGVMFYEMVTGRKPFEAESPMDMFLQHVKGKFPRPSRFAPDIPVWLDNLICQMLEKKPEDRPLSARMVAETLAQIQEKIEAQQSAGVERATARGKNKAQHRPELNDTDREAARTLLRKKKKKKKRIPFYQQGWFTLLSVAAVLAGLGYLIHYAFFTPPSLESLHKQTAVFMEKDDFDSWRAAQKGPLREFLTYYKDSDDKLAEQMRNWVDEAAYKVLEYQMYRRLGSQMPADEKGEALARLALLEEAAGKLSEALKTWDKLSKQIGDPDKEKHAWGLVGKQRYEVINGLAKRWEELFKKVKTEEIEEGRTKEEKLAVQAIQEYQADEIEQAIRLWEDLKELTAESSEKRFWFLLAAYESRRLSDLVAENQKKEENDNS